MIRNDSLCQPVHKKTFFEKIQIRKILTNDTTLPFEFWREFHNLRNDGAFQLNIPNLFEAVINVEIKFWREISKDYE